LKRYIYNVLSILQTKYCEITFRAFQRKAYTISHHPKVRKTTSLRQKYQQTRCYYRIATKLAKISISAVTVSIKYPWKEKTVLQDKFDLTINFDLMIYLAF